MLIITQNSRSRARGCEGAPGDRNGARPVTSRIQLDGFPTTLSDQVLLPPVEPSQYMSAEFAEFTSRAGLVRSVGRTGVCYDNAWAESFNATLKVERVHRTVYPTRRHAIRDIARYIELRYNQKRLHSALGYRTPNEAEQDWYETNKAA
ncbi:integrase core domain-containing protein [Tessaracoccus defluvii]|uniref:integrase core domain-containing protein n=1 Tax=Tessaracoccus defluvii TaxID=1285901 RepID=UPI003872D408